MSNARKAAPEHEPPAKKKDEDWVMCGDCGVRIEGHRLRIAQDLKAHKEQSGGKCR